MFQEFGLSSNIPLIVITLIVVILSILFYIESRKISKQFDILNGKLSENVNKIDLLKNQLSSLTEVKHNDHNRNDELVQSKDDESKQMSEEIIDNENNENKTNIHDKQENNGNLSKENVKNEAPEIIQHKVKIPVQAPPHPVLAMMMGDHLL